MTDHHYSSIGGISITVILWIISKITLSDVATIATILSASTVILVNIPKLIPIYKKIFKRNKK